MVSPLDPQMAFDPMPMSLWDNLAEQLAAQGVEPPMAFAGEAPTQPGVGLPPRPVPSMGIATPQAVAEQHAQRPQPAPAKSQNRVPQPPAGPPIPVNQFVGPIPPENSGSPLDPQQQPMAMAEPSSSLDIRSTAQQQGQGGGLGQVNSRSVRDSLGLALQGLKMMEAPQLRAPHPVAPPRPDTGGLGKIDPIVLMQNAQKTGVAPLLLLSQLLGRG